MTILFLILILLTCGLLGFIVLVQNPKGGGLSGSLSGLNTQFMGVKQTTDVLEKGTWIFASAVGILCLISSLFIGSGSSNPIKNINTNVPTQQAPAQPAAPAK